MAWTTPLDWTTDQVVTAADMDTYVSGNTQYLKDVLGGVANQAIHFLGALTVDGAGAFNGTLETFGVFTAQDNINGQGLLSISPPGGGGSTSGIDTTGTLYTQAGGLDIAGNAVIDGTLTVGGQPLRSAGARVYNSAAQSITNATETTLAFNTERYDTDGFHSTSVNTSRLTVPSGMGGKYHIWANVEWGPLADATNRYIRLRINGSTVIAVVDGPNVNTASFATAQCISTVYELAASDYVEVRVRQDSGGAINVSSSANYSPEFSMARIG